MDLCVTEYFACNPRLNRKPTKFSKNEAKDLEAEDERGGNVKV